MGLHSLCIMGIDFEEKKAGGECEKRWKGHEDISVCFRRSLSESVRVRVLSLQR